MSTDATGRRRIRASDAEREHMAQILRAAMTEGRLSLQEGEERLATAYAATYRDELDPLTVDLPDGGRRALFDTPEVRTAIHRGMRNHVLVVGVVAVLLVLAWAASGAHFFWPLFPLAFLTLGLLRHYRWRRWGAYGGPPWHRHGGPPWHRQGTSGTGGYSA